MLVSLQVSKDSYKGQFRFDKRFLFQPLVKESIALFWNVRSSGRLATVSERLRNCRKTLNGWKKRNNLNVRDRLQKIEVNLEQEYL